MKKLILLVIVLAIGIYVAYPYLTQMGVDMDAIPGITELMDKMTAANEKITVTEEGAKNLYMKAQEVKEFLDMASWKAIDTPADPGEAKFSLNLGENYDIALYDQVASVTDAEGKTQFYSIGAEAWAKIQEYIADKVATN